MAGGIKFGTNGWRGVIAEDFTFDNVRLCAQGVANYISQIPELSGRGFVIGYDTRFGSADFARAAAEVISGNGIKVFLTPKPTPTPVISFAIRKRGCGGGIIITASHNPYRWSGFKFRTYEGAPAPKEVGEWIEKHLSPPKAPKEEIEYYDPIPEYLEAISKLVDIEGIKNSGLSIVIDPMYGVGCGLLSFLLSGGKIKLFEIHNEPHPLFPGLARPEPVEENLAQLSKAVIERGAAVGIATDGDGDRVGIVDENGRFITPLQVFPLLALYLFEHRKQRGAIVKTVPDSYLLYKLGEVYQAPVFETPVGFKYVAEVMLRENALIGGEESGGYGFRGHVPERDGFLAGLFFLELMIRSGKTPSQLLSQLYHRFGPYHYRRIDLSFPAHVKDKICRRLEDAHPSKIAGLSLQRKDTVDGFRFILHDGSWLLIRFSGTEPLLRLYCESHSPQQVERILAYGRELIGL